MSPTILRRSTGPLISVAQEHIYSALTYNAANDILYAATASYCDDTPYDGRLVAIDAASGTVAATFMPVTSTSGGGMWGMGGVSINTTDNDVFVATGNPPSQYGESLVRLSSSLAVSVSNRPAIISGDYDFGSTPLLVQTPGCAAQVILKNKNGQHDLEPRCNRQRRRAAIANGLQHASRFVRWGARLLCGN